ncbi:putative receptor-like protein kinase, partial [Dorcoceras hygrometricum]
GSPSLVKRFSYHHIKKATDGFKRVVHNSPEGDSYKAVFRNGLLTTVREVKAFDEDDHFFYREVELLGCLNHRHIVSLIGFSTGYKRFLVFENSGDTNLMEHLSDPLKTPLNWQTRLQITIGIAAALEYLHFFCDPSVYLVSLNSRTILLDENLIPKISEIGFLGSDGNHDALPSSSCCLKGCTRQECKNMVFQLGLLILELITGQSSEMGGVDLVQWIRETNFPRSMNMMIDPDLGNNYDSGELIGLIKVARFCIRSVNKDRIHTHQILWYLQKKVGIVRK